MYLYVKRGEGLTRVPQS
ncbi:MAG: hypothetical protein NWQ45_03175, partial [Congregibacter sp.]|nr:hypothetical protein [Congregibacter sp.]